MSPFERRETKFSYYAASGKTWNVDKNTMNMLSALRHYNETGQELVYSVYELIIE